MKEVIFLFLVFLNTNAFADNLIKDALSIFTKTDLDIKYVGNITLGEPYVVTGSFKSQYTHIPFTFTDGQWHENSAQGFHGTKSSVQGSVINFTCQKGLGYPKGLKKEIVLKNLSGGNYIVNYQNPDGSIVYVGTIKLEH
ncbi:MAG: hypothetical protein COV35_04460 [Alphaproteobacteria bacterium CG11_big_fil_rev_8_21_14_0_20_39_49]|nr:MAG: hypothetical protein COV35_04460 [Alphaproteobacteria bacterium CG11_big_fil_rev_8_21_14_0_20_39_49]